MFRVQEFSNHLNKMSQLVYSLGPRVTVDESVCAFKGLHRSKQYFKKDNPTKFGFRVFSLCYGDTGYCYAHRIYQGAGSIAADDGDAKFVHSLIRNYMVPTINSDGCGR